MMTSARRVAGTLLLASSILSAQAPTMTATITQPLAVFAGYPSSQQSLPAGPLPAAGANLAVATNPFAASAFLDAVPTASGFRLRAGGGAILAPHGYGTFTTGGEIVLDLTLPSPAPVLVRITGTAAFGGAGMVTEVDLDNDQTVEVSLSAPFPVPTAIDLEFGLLVGPTGRSIRLRNTGSGAAGFSNVGVDVDLTLSFVVGASPLEAYGPGCIALGWQRDATGTANLASPAPTGSLGFFAFGFTPRQIPLPIAPGCFQLLDPLFAVPVIPSNGVATFTQPALALPPGLAVRFQAAVLGAGGALQTSNGLVMTGPM